LAAPNNYYASSFSGAAKGSGYDALSDSQKEERIRGTARALADMVQSGTSARWITIKLTASYATFLPELSEIESMWLFDELKKMGVLLLSVSEAHDWIVANGTKTESTLTLPANPAPDFRLLPNSPAIHTGTHIDGITADIIGLPFANPPSMGAYEFQGRSPISF